MDFLIPELKKRALECEKTVLGNRQKVARTAEYDASFLTTSTINATIKLARISAPQNPIKLEAAALLSLPDAIPSKFKSAICDIATPFGRLKFFRSGTVGLNTRFESALVDEQLRNRILDIVSKTHPDMRNDLQLSDEFRISLRKCEAPRLPYAQSLESMRQKLTARGDKRIDVKIGKNNGVVARVRLRPPPKKKAAKVGGCEALPPDAESIAVTLFGSGCGHVTGKCSRNRLGEAYLLVRSLLFSR